MKACAFSIAAVGGISATSVCTSASQSKARWRRAGGITESIPASLAQRRMKGITVVSRSMP
jgi:hypothetical protein